MFKVICPNGQLKAKQGIKCFVIAAGILFQNKLKVTPWPLFLGIKVLHAPKRGGFKAHQAIFQQYQTLSSQSAWSDNDF